MIRINQQIINMNRQGVDKNEGESILGVALCAFSRYSRMLNCPLQDLFLYSFYFAVTMLPPVPLRHH